MRLFVAVDLSDSVRAAAARLALELQAQLARTHAAQAVRWVAPQHLHMTIRFIGEVDDQRAAAIRSVMQPALPVPPFDVGFGGLGTFPSSGAPRVVWVGTTCGADGLTEIHGQVEERLVRAGCNPDDRPFRTHLTLGRVREGSRGRATALQEAVALAGRERPTEIGVSRVRCVTVYQSRLGPTGPTYTPLVVSELSGVPTGGPA